MADKPKYPFSVYNKDGAVLQVNNDNELASSKQKGYQPKYVFSHFPKTLYHKQTGATLLVADEAAMQAAVGKKDDGDYTDEFVAAPAPKAELPKEPAADDTSTVRALLAEIHEMKNRQDDIEDRCADLEKAFDTLAKAAAKPAPAPKKNAAGAATAEGAQS